MLKILDLCGGTGAWSYYYSIDPKYSVEVVTLPNQDVRDYQVTQPIHGILAAPPCTYFSKARYIAHGFPTDEQLEESMSIVNACLRIVEEAKPVWWALENPAFPALLETFIGSPKLEFDPWQYGNPWTKRTGIWGEFKVPPFVLDKKPSPMYDYSNYFSWIYLNFRTRYFDHIPYDRYDRQTLRAVTPNGFAKAFKESNA